MGDQASTSVPYAGGALSGFFLSDDIHIKSISYNQLDSIPVLSHRFYKFFSNAAELVQNRAD